MTPVEIFYRTREVLIEKYGEEFLELDTDSQNNIVFETLRELLEKGGR